MKKITLSILITLLSSFLIFHGLSSLLKAEDKPAVPNQSAEEWHEYALSAIDKSWNQPIKIMTTSQITENKAATDCSTYLLGKLMDNVKIIFINLNKNNRYDDAGTDGIIIGENSYVIPFSNIINIKNILYEIKIDTEKKPKVMVKPYTGPTGYIDMVSQYKSKESLKLIIISSDKKAYFDVIKSKAFAVPCGNYTLQLGYWTGGNARVVIKSNKMAKIAVTPANTDKVPVTVTWGAPIKIDFKVSASWNADKQPELKVNYGELKYLGSAGEEYSNFTPSLGPDVFVFDAQKSQVGRGAFIAKPNDVTKSEHNNFEGLMKKGVVDPLTVKISQEHTLLGTMTGEQTGIVPSAPKK
jgi:hypothetical protein